MPRGEEEEGLHMAVGVALIVWDNHGVGDKPPEPSA